MRRRLLVWTVGVLVALVVAALVLLLRQSILAGVVRASAEARLSAALGQPVTIGEIGFSLFPRPSFTGAEVRVGAAGEQAPGVRLERVRILPRVRSFFTDTIRIEEVRLDGFSVAILRDAQGRWRVPAAVPAPGAGGGGVAIERVRIAGGTLRIFRARGDGALGEASSIDDIEADLVIDAEGLRLVPLRGRVGAAAIAGEAVVNAESVRLVFDAPAIADADLPRFLGLAGASRPALLRFDEQASASVTVTIDRAASRLSGNGTIRIPVLTVEPLRLQRLEAPFTISGSRFTFEPTTFALNGGTHRGRVSLLFDRDPPRWSSESRVEGLDVGAMLDTLAGRDARVDGTGRVEATLNGRLARSFMDGIEGPARLTVHDGVLHGFPLLATVNRALRLAEGDTRDTRFERLAATLAIARSAARTDDLTIEAGHLRAELAGVIGFEGALDLRGRAYVTAEHVAAGVASVRELARLKNARGEVELPLVIGGTFDAPRFEIDIETAIRRGVQDELLRRLKGLIRRD